MRSILQIFNAAFTSQENRDWTEEETLALFHDLHSSKAKPKNSNRTPAECVDHYGDIVGTLFEILGSSRVEGIRRAARKFYDTEEARQSPFTEEQTVRMVIQFLVNRQPIAKGFDQDIEECKAHYNRLMEWIFREFGVSPYKVICVAIDTFYKKNKRHQKTV